MLVCHFTVNCGEIPFGVYYVDIIPPLEKGHVPVTMTHPQFITEDLDLDIFDISYWEIKHSIRFIYNFRNQLVVN